MKACFCGFLSLLMLVSPPVKAKFLTDNNSNVDESPTDWTIYICHDSYMYPPDVYYKHNGLEILASPVGQCIKGSPCYDFPDPQMRFIGFQKRFIFAISSKMKDLTIEGHSVPEGMKGIFVYNKGNLKPLEEVDGLVQPWSKPTEEQPIKSHLVTFEVPRDRASRKKGYILEYEMAPSTALKKGLLQTMDNRIGRLKMTVRKGIEPWVSGSLVCQPAIPPGYTLRRLTVLNGDLVFFDSEVEQESLPFVLKIQPESSNIHNGVADRQEPIPQTSTTDQKPADHNTNSTTEQKRIVQKSNSTTDKKSILERIREMGHK